MLLSILLNLLFLVYFIRNFFRFNPSKKCWFLFIIIYLFEFYLNFYGINERSRIIILVCNLFLIQYIFIGNFVQKLIYFVIAYFILSIAETIPLKIFEYYGWIDYASNIDVDSLSYLFMIIATQIIAFTLGMFIAHILKSDKQTKVIYFSAIPLCLTLIFIMSINVDLLINNDQNVFLIFVILVAISIISIIYQHNYFIAQKIKKELEISEIQKELITSRYKMLNKHYNENFQFLHDLLHSINHLNTVLETGSIDTAKEDLNKLSNEVFRKYTMIYTNSPIISAILNEKKDFIERNNISLSTTLKGDFFEAIKMNVEMQTQLLSEIIEIVLNKCVNCEKKHRILIIKSYSSQNQFIYNFTFYSNDDGFEDVSKFNNELYKRQGVKIMTNFDSKTSLCDFMLVFDIR